MFSVDYYVTLNIQEKYIRRKIWMIAQQNGRSFTQKQTNYKLQERLTNITRAFKPDIATKRCDQVSSSRSETTPAISYRNRYRL